MRNRVVIVILLSFNLGFLVYLATQPPASTTSQNSLSPHTNIAPPGSPNPQPEPEQLVQVVTNDFEWRQLESEDYREYIARLRRIGCPEETLRDIIISDLDKLFAPQLQSLYPYRTNLQYWHPEDDELLNEVDAREVLRRERAIEREKQAVVRELIGVNLTGRRLNLKGQHDFYDRRLGFLDPDKRSEVKDLLEQAHDRDWQLREKLVDGESLTAEERIELARIREEKESALNAVLSPGEQSKFNLWMSDTAHAVRHDIYGMDATETEFLAIYNVRREFDKAWPPDEFDLDDPAVRAQWELAQEETDVRIMKELGQDRFLAYKRGQDPEFHALAGLLTRHDFPRDVAVRIYDFRTAYQDQRDAVAYSRNIPESQKDQILEGLLSETSNSIAQILGDEAFRDFQRNASWLK